MTTTAPLVPNSLAQRRLDREAREHSAGILSGHRARTNPHFDPDVPLTVLLRNAASISQEYACPSCGVTIRLQVRGAEPQCACEEAVYRAALEAYLSEHRPAYIKELIDRSGLDRQKRCSFANFEARTGTVDAVATCQAYVESFGVGKELGLWLFGSWGAGKTHLAIATARALLTRHLVEVMFTSAGEIVSNVLGDGGPTTQDWSVIEAAASIDLLVLDDLGQERSNPTSRDVVWRVIDGRYRRGLPILITTNLGDAQLKKHLGGAVVSRLYEMCQGVDLRGAEDYRKEIAFRRQRASGPT